MKILHVIQHFRPSQSFGGTPVVCHNQCVEMVEAGHQVDVLTTDVFSKTDRVREFSKYSVTSYGYGIHRIKNLVNSWAFVQKLSTPFLDFLYIHKIAGQYDIIHLHEYRSVLHFLVCIATAGKKPKIVIQPNGTFEIYGGREVFKQIFDLFYAPLVLSKISHFFAINKKEIQALRHKNVPVEKISLLENGVEPLKSTKSRGTLKVPEKYILYLGRISQAKAVGVLIAAFKQSQLAKKGISLVIAGTDDGDLASVLRNVSNKIQYIGPLKDEQKNFVLEKAICLSYVTLQEGFGIVPIEAAVLGTPSIVDKDAGNVDIINRYKLGLVVTVGEVAELAKALVKLCNQPSRIPVNTRQTLLKRLSWNSIATQALTVYSDLVVKK